MTDTERLDFLQELLEEGRYTGNCVMRLSSTGRGWRLHESSRNDAVCDVRDAIDQFYEYIGHRAKKILAEGQDDQ